MSRPVRILGIGADGVPGLPTRSRDEIAAATFLAGGRRHLEMVGETRAETFVVTNNLPELADRLAADPEEGVAIAIAVYLQFHGDRRGALLRDRVSFYSPGEDQR